MSLSPGTNSALRNNFIWFSDFSSLIYWMAILSEIFVQYKVSMSPLPDVSL